MPELPEVETLKRDLKIVKGQTIKSVSVDWPKTVLPLSIKSFQAKLKNKKIINIKRRAKMLIFELSDKNSILVHLKMTGQLIYQPKEGKIVYGGHPQEGGADNLPNKFTRVVIQFKDGSTLFFNDMRKFGWMRLVDQKQLHDITDKYGVEPLIKDFTLERLKEILKRYPNRKIKHLLGDQSLIAGLGNIYLDESCWCAKIKPTRIVSSLKPKEIKALFNCIPKILKLAIFKNGTSFSDYVQLDGKQGRMVKWLKVYNKAGQKCSRCKSVIKKIKLNQRGTHFCPNCQK